MKTTTETTETRVCPKCDGKGEIYDEEGVECPECNGVGWVVPVAREAGHTPGPWEGSPEGNVWAPRARHAVICKMSAHAKSESQERANARLISAAPDLLAACEAAVKWINPSAGPEPSAAVRLLRAAIAKAKP